MFSGHYNKASLERFYIFSYSALNCTSAHALEVTIFPILALSQITCVTDGISTLSLLKVHSYNLDTIVLAQSSKLPFHRLRLQLHHLNLWVFVA